MEEVEQEEIEAAYKGGGEREKEEKEEEQQFNHGSVQIKEVSDQTWTLKTLTAT